MRLYVTRHGQTVWNQERRYQGQSDSPLTAEGEKQAERLAWRLAAEPLDVAYSSDLRRAWRTAELALAGRALPIQHDPAWRECAYGQWEGKTRDEIAALFPEQWQRCNADRVHNAPLGGETLLAVQQRVGDALDRLYRRHNGQNVLVVTHACTLFVLACIIHGDDMAAGGRPGLSNCGLTVLRYTDDRPTIEYWDDTAHLTPEGVASS